MLAVSLSDVFNERSLKCGGMSNDNAECAQCGGPIPPRLDPRGRRAKYCSPSCRAAASRKRASARHAAELAAARAAARPALGSVEDRFVRAARELIEEMLDAPADRLGSQKMRDVVAAARVITGWYEPEQMALSQPVPTLSRQQRRAAARRRR